MDIQNLADGLRRMTLFEGDQLREAMGPDDVQRFASTLGVSISDQRRFKINEEHVEMVEEIAFKKYPALQAELETLRLQIHALSGSSKATGVVGATIVLRSGRLFDYVAPTVDMIDIEDIAWGLAKEGRYANQLPGDLVYNVAQHSCMVHDHAEPEERFQALMHDAPEAYVKDVPKPLKLLIGDGYKAAEDRVHLVIAQRFSFDPVMSKSLKRLDWRTLNTEKKFLSTRDKREDWNGLNEYPPFEDVHGITPWDVTRSAEEFLDRFYDLRPQEHLGRYGA